MTNQDVFDAVVEHLAIQGRQSLTAAETCGYRGSGGDKCAVGVLIPDGIYEQDLEGEHVKKIIKNHPKIKKIFSGVSIPLLMQLQQIHDDKNNWQSKSPFLTKAAAKKLRALAIAYDLSDIAVHQYFLSKYQKISDQDRFLLICLPELGGSTSGQIVRNMGEYTNVRSKAQILRRDLERLMGERLVAKLDDKKPTCWV